MDNNIIKHIPYGLNPYEKKGYERYPQNPKDGDTVIVNAIIAIKNSDEKVVLNWSLNGISENSIEAEIINENEECSTHCSFNLGKFKVGDNVKYNIEVQSGKKCIKSRDYSFVVLSDYTVDRVRELNFINNSLEIVFDKIGQYSPRAYFLFKNESLKILTSLSTYNIDNSDTCCFKKLDEDRYIYSHEASGYSLEVRTGNFKLTVKDNRNNILFESWESFFSFLNFAGDNNGNAKSIKLNIKTSNEYFYGFGEKFDILNQKGLNPDSLVYEKFTCQDNITYMPIPFFITEKGYGMFVNTPFYTTYSLSGKFNSLLEIECKIDGKNQFLDLIVYFGQPKDILKKFLDMTGRPKLPPKWSFGPWMSSNRWNTQEETLKQVDLMNKYEIPATVIVLEAWSDEATFYSFNGGSMWPDPKSMIDHIHKNNMRFILWQIPVIKYFEEHENEQHKLDEEYVIKKGYCVLNQDGSPYRINDNWFGKSLLFDFSNPEAKKWWFEKRKYLLDDLKVDGFKTDGGEFVYDEETCFHNGKKGDEMRNLYPIEYISAYHDFIGDDRITFSRAGFTGAQKYPMYWGGDKKSTFEELRSTLVSGLSINISGNPFWGFDIGGFAGKIPSSELYIRSTQLAAFSPVMQFHSEPTINGVNNDRTPWNVSDYNNDKTVIDIYRWYANLRMNLIPYIYNEAVNVSINNEPFMRSLMFDYPEDKIVYDISDEYMFGRYLLVAPILDENSRQRSVYLPEGEWIDFWDGCQYQGARFITYSADINRIPVFIKNNSIIAFNLNDKFELGDRIGNDISKYQKLCFLAVGNPECEYVYIDDLGNRITISPSETCLNVDISGNMEEVYTLHSKGCLTDENSQCVRINNINCIISRIINETRS